MKVNLCFSNRSRSTDFKCLAPWCLEARCKVKQSHTLSTSPTRCLVDFPLCHAFGTITNRGCTIWIHGLHRMLQASMVPSPFYGNNRSLARWRTRSVLTTRTGRQIHLQIYICEHNKTGPSGALLGNIKERYKDKS